MSPDASESTDAQATQGKITRGAFPRVPLKEVLPLAEKVYELGHGEPVRRRTVLESLRRSADSSVSKKLVNAAAGGYGITKGGFTAVHLELTPQGEKVIKAQNSAERRRAIHDVLFSNPLFVSLVERFNDRPITQDEVFTDFLQRSHGLSDADAKSCWTTARENMEEFGLIEPSNGKQVIVSRDHAQMPDDDSGKDELRDVDSQDPEGGDEEPADDQNAGRSVNSRDKAPPRPIQPELHFNIQVVLPSEASAETFDSIFRSIATHLMGKAEN